jgi:tetratricopeptide (TPR) repeat protein
MSPENPDFREVMAAWVATTDFKAIDTGLSREDATRHARELVRELRGGKTSTGNHLDHREIDVLHAACFLLPELELPDSQNRLEDALNVFNFIEEANWPGPDFDERSELLADAAFSAWRVARKKGTPAEAETWRKRFLSLAESVSTIQSGVEQVLSALRDGPEDPAKLPLRDLEILLSVFGALRRRVDKAPASVRDDAERLYGLLNESKLEVGLSEEREFFLVELALLAGMTSRLMFRRQDAWGWFARAEAKIALTTNSSTQAARLMYHRLALRAEERHFDEVLQLGRRLRDDFLELGLTEDALKCRFLESAALQETRRSQEAVEVLKIACAEAEGMGNLELLSKALSNLTIYCRTLGDLKQALLHGQRALPLLQQLDDRVNLAKFGWAVGDVLREQGRLGEAIAAYRAALVKSEEVDTRCDSASIHLVLAEALLDIGLNEEAELEVRAALPIIEEEKMVPEGYAALALLQESLRRRKIDRQALRNLHGFFQDEQT